MRSQTQQLCDRYLDMLERWNKIHNLTALNTRQQMQEQLVEQSLLLQSYLVGKVADIGTGAGIPGIPLAIALPDTKFTLIDSRAKKIIFVRQVANALGLGNVEAIRARAEDCVLGPFDTIISRALGSLTYINSITAGLRHDASRLLCIRGRFDPSELSDIPLRLIESVALSTDRENNLVIMAP